jgi:hypothetical protein
MRIRGREGGRKAFRSTENLAFFLYEPWRNAGVFSWAEWKTFTGKFPTRKAGESTNVGERGRTCPSGSERMATYGVKDLCERFAVGEHTVLGWIRRGELRAINVSRKPGSGQSGE